MQSKNLEGWGRRILSVKSAWSHSKFETNLNNNSKTRDLIYYVDQACLELRITVSLHPALKPCLLKSCCNIINKLKVKFIKKKSLLLHDAGLEMAFILISLVFASPPGIWGAALSQGLMPVCILFYMVSPQLLPRGFLPIYFNSSFGSSFRRGVWERHIYSSWVMGEWARNSRFHAVFPKISRHHTSLSTTLTMLMGSL